MRGDDQQQNHMFSYLSPEMRVRKDPDAHCTDPVTCEFFDRCNLPRPDAHIGYLPRIQASAIEELKEMGIESIRDIPDDYPLNERLRRACICVQTGEPWYSPELSKELKTLKYPLYFMDFETLNPAIPRFKGMRPNQQIPFQWSVHVLKEPGGEPEHFEFLATDASDPRQIQKAGAITSGDRSLKPSIPSKSASPAASQRSVC